MEKNCQAVRLCHLTLYSRPAPPPDGIFFLPVDIHHKRESTVKWGERSEDVVSFFR